MAITVTQLSAFTTVARRGSASAAAAELVVTPTSVSAAIAALERELGVQLTERVGRGLRLTPAGTSYATHALHVLGLLREGREMAHQAAGDTSRLRIGAVTTAAEYLLPALIAGFRRHHTDLEINLDVGNRDLVLRRLASHETDVAIGGSVPDGEGFRAHAFAENEFVLITAPGDARFRRRLVAPDELASRPWLVRERGSGTRALCESFLNARELRPSLSTFGSNGAIKQAVQIGLGVTLLPRVAVETELSLGLLQSVAVRGGLPTRRWYVAASTVGPRREIVEEFMAFVCSGDARVTLDRARTAERDIACRTPRVRRAGVGVGIGVGLERPC